MSDALDYLEVGDLSIPTDPDILGVYAHRIAQDTDMANISAVLVSLPNRLLWIARGCEPFTPVQVAAHALTELGEQATPVRDEGVPCG